MQLVKQRFWPLQGMLHCEIVSCNLSRRNVAKTLRDKLQERFHSVTEGAFHYAKASGNFGRNANGRSVSVSSDRNIQITSGGGPLISVGIFRSKFAVPFLTNPFFALIREFGNDKKWQELFLLIGAV